MSAVYRPKAPLKFVNGELLLHKSALKRKMRSAVVLLGLVLGGTAGVCGYKLYNYKDRQWYGIAGYSILGLYTTLILRFVPRTA